MLKRSRIRLAGILGLLAVGTSGLWLARAQDPGSQAPGAASGEAAPARKGVTARDVVYVPTPQEVVDKMLELAEIKTGDVLYDLGCGDGRIVVTAARRYWVKATGFDVDPRRIKESKENVRRNGVAGLVTIKQEDIFQQDLSGASVVTMYLLPGLNVRLMPQLEKLKPGSRIVSHSFNMRGAKPSRIVKVARKDGLESTVYLWVVPWEKEGESTTGR